jgi:hypothetical protein
LTQPELSKQLRDNKMNVSESGAGGDRHRQYRLPKPTSTAPVAPPAPIELVEEVLN